MNKKQTTVTEKRYGEYYVDDLAITLRAESASYGGGQRSACHLLYQRTIGSLCATDYKWVQQEQVMQGKLILECEMIYGIGNGQLHQLYLQDKIGALNCMADQQKILKDGDDMDGCKTVVRRLTPLECERLQGFPDGWTDIGEWTDSKGKAHKESSDSARYKALGNSIAVGYANGGSGYWMTLLKRISAQYERNATLGSLFDGIGGFPLAWEHYNGKGSAVWASEIEEFPIAVTKKRFPES